MIHVNPDCTAGLAFPARSGGRSSFISSLLVVFAVVQAHPRISRAQDHGPVLFFCDDLVLGKEGGCSEMHRTLKKEMADFGLTLIDSPFNVIDVPAQGPVPEIIVEKASEAGAIFAVWFSVMKSSQGNLPVMHVYDPDNRQVFSRMGAPASAEGELDYQDMAFRLRNLMGASLYSDLEGILEEEALLSLAIPEEKRETIGEVVGAAPEKRSWVSLGLGYHLVGYPTEKSWYHGFEFEVAVLPVKRLDVFIDGGVVFLPGVVARQPEGGVHLQFENRQVLMGLGARYALLRLGPVEVAPAAGFRLGISMTRVARSVNRDFLRVNPALWGGLVVRISIVERFAFTVGMRLENVFRYETFKWGETRLFSLSPFRFSATTGILVRL